MGMNILLFYSYFDVNYERILTCFDPSLYSDVRRTKIQGIMGC